MTTVTSEAAVPGTLELGLARGAAELREFFRQKENLIFTVSLPAILMLLLGTVYVHEAAAGQMFAASMIGAGIISTSFVGLGISVVADREDGTLKRLRGTPMPFTSYFIGKIILVFVSSLFEAVLLMVVAMLRFDVELPSTAEKWFTFGWVFLLGVISCSLIGVALSSIAQSTRSASGVLNLPYIVLQFLSGVFISQAVLPESLRVAGSLFPLKWVCQGFRSVFALNDGYAVMEAAGSWELGRIALVLGAWTIAGLVLVTRTFRWTNEAS
ncbi:ABC transporter permease [Lentzea flava]|uniref:Transport permease protein n=1 Tax=Lentzea flava TaxID=103732 RepID=A0ABQ2VCY4_9PSEU|nr:ABC transporter permease [Lentzea flava]MCP2204755.1 ABC-2 type transport system permease protein [Lentzea flava]GGU80696.1 transport permease protein [Lentzea flava]